MAVDIDGRPRRRRPLVTGSGVLVVVCLFLPTLRVCGDPTAPIEFPPVYPLYVASAIIGTLGFVRGMRTARGWLTAWMTLWLLGGVSLLSLLTVDQTGDTFAVVILVAGVAISVPLLWRFHQRRFADRAMFVAGILQGLLVTGWYLSLVSDKDQMWGAYVGLAAGFAQTITSAMALSSATADHREQQRDGLPSAVARLRTS